jgi:putative aldouronate transport system substrate-binding protein
MKSQGGFAMKQRTGVFTVLLSVALGASVGLTGCSKDNGSENTPAPAENTPVATQKRNVGGLELPISDKGLELSLWIPADGNFRGKNYNEKHSFQQMEKNTGIKINFLMANSTGWTDQFNLLMSSGKLPDMIFNYEWDKHVVKYGSNGALLPLEQLIDKHAPNIKRLLQEKPDVRGQITSPDGHIYYLPNVALENIQLIQLFPQIREDWLTKLNLKSPETTDDWYNVLKAFREKDPNGNGQKDEIPLTSVNLENIMRLFAPAFGVEYDFFVENGQVKYGPYDSRFLDVVTYLNKLYSEQLLDPNYLVDADFKLLTEKVTTDRAGSWFGWAGSYMGTFTNLMKEKKHPTFKIAPVVPPKGPRGDQRHVSVRWPATGIGLAVSSQTKYPEEVIKWLDYQYSEEGVILNNYGVEGISYDLVDGKPKYRKEVTNPEGGLTGTQALLLHTIGGGSWATISLPDAGQQMAAASGQTENPLKLYEKYVDFSKKIPPLQFLPEESNVIVPIMADVDTYVKEMVNGFIMGKKPLSEFAQFQSTLKKMNMDKVLEIYQKSYNRFKGKS